MGFRQTEYLEIAQKVQTKFHILMYFKNHKPRVLN